MLNDQMASPMFSAIIPVFLCDVVKLERKTREEA